MNTLLMHGDVLLRPVSKLPDNLKPVPKRLAKGSHITRPDIILAEGEHTGHAHRITCEDGEAELFERDGTLYLVVNKPVQVSHEEHATKPIEAGSYVIGFQREWDYLEKLERQVMD
jgi:hypothetical protein